MLWSGMSEYMPAVPVSCADGANGAQADFLYLLYISCGCADTSVVMGGMGLAQLIVWTVSRQGHAQHYVGHARQLLQNVIDACVCARSVRVCVCACRKSMDGVWRQRAWQGVTIQNT